MTKPSTFLTALAIAGLFLLGACEQRQEETGEMEEPLIEEPGAVTEAGPVEVGLEAKAESGITGTALVTPLDAGIEVALDLEGLTAGETYAAHLHRGTCDNDQGVAAPLEDVVVTGTTGESVTTIGSSMLDPSVEYYFVQVHEAGVPVACGDVPEEAGLAELGAPSGQPATEEPGEYPEPQQP